METVNIEVVEHWYMTCPHCDHQEDASFNHDNPMTPMVVKCFQCGEEYLLTFEKD